MPTLTSARSMEYIFIPSAFSLGVTTITFSTSAHAVTRPSLMAAPSKSVSTITSTTSVVASMATPTARSGFDSWFQIPRSPFIMLMM